MNPPDTDDGSSIGGGGDRVGRTAWVEAVSERLSPASLGVLEAVGWALVSAPVVHFAVSSDRPRGVLWPEIYDAIHVLLSAVAALIALRLSRRVWAGAFRRPAAHYWVAVVVLAGVGTGIEVLQIGRAGEASFLDLSRDLLGGVSALWIVSTLGPGGMRRPARRCWGVRAAGLATFGVLLWPLVSASGVVALQLRAFPILADFEQRWQGRFVTAAGGAVIAVQPPPVAFSSARGRGVARVQLTKGGRPSLSVGDLVGDWSPYRWLLFEVYSPQSSPITLELRVHDKHHGNRYSDRFNSTLRILPGQNTVSIALEDVRNGPEHRKMDMGAILGIIVFAEKPSEDRTLYFDTFRLK